jgi:hypothetical protein
MGTAVFCIVLPWTYAYGLKAGVEDCGVRVGGMGFVHGDGKCVGRRDVCIAGGGGAVLVGPSRAGWSKRGGQSISPFCLPSDEDDCCSALVPAPPIGAGVR